jgi:hypothetical protein
MTMTNRTYDIDHWMVAWDDADNRGSEIEFEDGDRVSVCWHELSVVRPRKSDPVVPITEADQWPTVEAWP